MIDWCRGAVVLSLGSLVLVLAACSAPLVEGRSGGAGPAPATAASTFVRVTVPNLIGRTVEEAERLLTAKGFLLGDTTSVVELNSIDGRVSRMTPLPDAMARPGSRVNLIISRSPPRTREPMCVVPNLIGLDERQARSALTAARLAVGQAPPKPESAVTSQSHPAGSSVRCGTAISFVLGQPRS